MTFLVNVRREVRAAALAISILGHVAPATSCLAAVALAFREETVAVLPLASSCSQGTHVEWEDGGDIRTGFGFVDAEDGVYFFNPSENSLSMMRSTPGAPPSWSTRSGPPLTSWSDLPHDGCVSADGTIWLATDRTTTNNRFFVHLLRPGSEAWERLGPVDDALLGRVTVAGRSFPSAKTIRLDVDAIGRLELYDFDRRSSPALVLADTTGILVPARRTKSPPGALTRAGDTVRLGGTSTIIRSGKPPTARRIETPGIYLGSDAAGNVYLRVSPRDEPATILRATVPMGGSLRR